MQRSPWIHAALAATTAAFLTTAAVAQPPEDGPTGRGPGGPPHDPLRAALDADGDGRISREEFRPPRPPRRPGPPDEGGEGRGPAADGGGPPRVEFGAGRPPRGERPQGRQREGRRPRGDGERPEGGPPRGPSPERFVGRAMEFDADGDGRLDRAELEQFAGEMQQRMRGGPRGPGGPEDGPPEDGPPEDGERPPPFEE